VAVYIAMAMATTMAIVITAMGIHLSSIMTIIEMATTMEIVITAITTATIIMETTITMGITMASTIHWDTVDQTPTSIISWINYARAIPDGGIPTEDDRT
jgi:hypothetical protein